MLSLAEYTERQKKAKFSMPEKVILTNNRELGKIIGWEPSDDPEFVTIELHPKYSSIIKSLTINISLIVRIEEKYLANGQSEFWIWISHHKLTTELAQNFVRKIMLG